MKWNIEAKITFQVEANTKQEAEDLADSILVDGDFNSIDSTTQHIVAKKI